MKKPQTFKLDPELIDELKHEAGVLNRPFNNYVEALLKDRPRKIKHKLFKQIISGNADNCYIRNKIGCHCTTECGYKKSMEEI